MNDSTVKITSRSALVRIEPNRYSPTICSLQRDCIVQILDSSVAEDGIKWVKISCGWFSSKDATGANCYIGCDEVTAKKFWASELNNRKRVAAALGQMLAKSQSLKTIRRVANSIAKEAQQFAFEKKSFLKVAEVSIEDLLITLTSSTGLRSGEILELIKITASQQSDPYIALVEIAANITEMLNLRPSLWVIKNLGVLATADSISKNDQFVTAAARGDWRVINQCLEEGQPLTAVHSELQYTALHAAADFGSQHVVEILLHAGIAVNVRDARLGRNALHFAAQSGRLEIVKMLLDHGADRNAIDFKEMLPYEVADEHGQHECREALKQVPPEIQFCQVVDCTATSISLRWTPPVTHNSIHAQVDEFIVMHESIIASESDSTAAQRYSTKDPYLAVEQLKPSTGHAFTMYSRSVAGVSKPSVKVIFFTKPSMPAPPPKIELWKVTKNGLVLAWHPPNTDNGAKLNMYQLEMTTDPDATSSSHASFMDSLSSSVTTNNIAPFAPVRSPQKRASAIATRTPQSRAEMVSMAENEKWHRIIKHRNVAVREKYLMGLEQGRQYFFRVRAHNEFGWSPWSDWSGPFTPQEGVRVRPIGGGLINVTWICPELTQGRQVVAYEMQACRPSGPKTNSISVFHPKESKDETASSASTFDFKTLFNDLKEPQVDVSGLIPGMKYQFRVRPNIDGIWGDWEVMGVASDVVPIPAAEPDEPTDVREKVYARLGENGEVLDSTRSATHHSVVVTWTNGVPNGSPVINFEIQRALVQPYRISDDDIKEAARRKTQRKSPTSTSRVIQYTGGDNMFTTAADLDDMGGDINMEEYNNLEWVEISKTAAIVSSNTFEAKDLIPGGAYIFRVRQQNSIGWSSYSKPSPIIRILMVAPPCAPQTTKVSIYYAIIEWEVQHDSFQFSTLEYEVGVGVVSVGQVTTPIITSQNENISADEGVQYEGVEWKLAQCRRPEDGGRHGGDQFNCNRVLVDDLCPWTDYVTRVRVRTVAGWSVWSKMSKTFRTLSPP